MRQDAQRRIEHEHPQHADDGRRHRIGPDQQRAIERAAAQRLIGHDRQQQGQRKRGACDRERENKGPGDRREIIGLAQKLPVILEPYEDRRESKGILKQKRLQHRLRGRPVKEYQNDGKLRRDQHIGQQPRLEDRLLLHDIRKGEAGRIMRARRVMTYRTAVFSNWRSIWLPRSTAASKACLAVFLPASACSISSAHTSRNWTMLPSRSPREFSVGSLLVNSFSGVSR